MKKKEIKIIKPRGAYGSSKDKALNPKKRDKLLDEITDLKNRVIYILGAFGGLRVGEIEQTRASWLERTKFGTKEVLAINIPAECRNNFDLYSLWRPKTKRPRTTYIFKAELAAEVYAFFLHNDHLNLKVRTMQERCYKFAGTSIHSLRATAQNYFNYDLQLPYTIIAVLLGHRKIETTMKHYTSLNRAQAEGFLINKFQEVKKE